MKNKLLLVTVLLLFIVIAIIPRNVSALNIGTGVDGTIIVRWIDYGDPRNERPEEINLVVGERLSPTMQHQTITLKESDAEITTDSKDSAITEWKFTKTGFDYFFTHFGEANFLYEYSEIKKLEELGYNEISSMITGDLHPTKYDFNGHAIEEAGTLVVTLVKNTLTTKNLTVIYNDSNARDSSYLRTLDFAIKGSNVADPIKQNAYYRFNILPTDTLKLNSNLDIYTKSIYISGTDAYQSGNPIIDYIFEEDSQNIPNRKIDYNIEGDNIIITVNYQAKTKVVPFKIIWEDYEDQLGLRPTELLLKAYDQNGNLEKEFTISSNSNWLTNETLYENMIYSNGTPIDYDIKVELDNNYNYSITKVGNGYNIVATLKNEDRIKKPSEDLNVHKKKTSLNNEANPDTFDNIISHVLMFFASIVGLLTIVKIGTKQISK